MNDLNSGWMGVDLDGTLAHYDMWRGEDHIGEPLAPMIKRVRAWLWDDRAIQVDRNTGHPTVPEV